MEAPKNWLEEKNPITMPRLCVGANRLIKEGCIASIVLKPQKKMVIYINNAQYPLAKANATKAMTNAAIATKKKILNCLNLSAIPTPGNIKTMAIKKLGTRSEERRVGKKKRNKK